MSGADDHLAVVAAPESAEEAGRCIAALRAAGFNPQLDRAAGVDRLAAYPVRVPVAELAEATGFLRGMRASQAPTRVAVTAMAPSAPPPAVSAAAPFLPPWVTALLPAAGRTLMLAAGVLVIAGGFMVLASMLQVLTSLRDH